MEVPPPTTSTNILSNHHHHLLEFLESQFKSRNDLSEVPSLITQLNKDCSDLDHTLLHLRNNLSLALSNWTSRSNDFRTAIHHLNPLLHNFRDRRMLDVELPLLAKEVARIDLVRDYAETTLKLEALVGDLEDAALSLIGQTSISNHSIIHSNASTITDSGQKQQTLLLAIKVMKEIEEILVVVAKRRAHWGHLLMAVDSRVEKALAILRPQAITDHQVLLASLGWPPSLSTSNTEKGKNLEILNLLLLIQGEKKEKYSHSFLALCALQHLQTQRAVRQCDLLSSQKGYHLSGLVDVSNQPCLEHDLWAIEELVRPIASRMEFHFSRWSNEPKFIFALVFKITRDFLDGVDNVLQPLIDKAMLVGCSAKEAWVSAMVKMLSKYLKGQVFPALAKSYDGMVVNLEVNSSWLHLVDHMISFDKRMHALAALRTPLMGSIAEFEGLSRSLSIFSIFHEHLDWLEIWAAVELMDAQEKLKSEMEDERYWMMGIRRQAELTQKKETESFILSTREDYKAPLIADSVVKSSWAMIERGHSLLKKTTIVQFIRSSAALFLNHFFIILLQRCQDLDFMTTIIEDDALLRVIGSVNIARYCESVLQEWAENVGFLEMSAAEDNQHPVSSFFDDEIMFLVKLETDCLVEITTAILLQFDALCWEYVQNVEQWGGEQNKSENKVFEERNLAVSPGFIEALEMLRDRMEILWLNLNSKDFLDLWRSIASGIDHFIFTSIPLSHVKFSPQGVDQFKVDMSAIFIVFSPFCARSEAFFPCTSDSLKLLTMDWKDAGSLLKVICKGGSMTKECLQLRGLFHVSVGQTEQVLRNRKPGCD